MNEPAAKISVKAWVIAYTVVVLVSWCINYPGRLTPDSYSMLTQAYFPQEIDNWHSPTVTWLWSLLSPPLGQPAGALLVQSLLVFPYPAALLVDKSQCRPLAIAFILPLIGLSGLIIKDMILAASLLCSFGALHYFSGSRRAWTSAILAVIGILVRPTNFILLAIAGLIWSSAFRGWLLVQKMIVLFVFSVLAFGSSYVVNEEVFGAKDVLPERSLIIFDVVGVSNNIGRDLFAGLPGWPEDQLPKPWTCYTPRYWDSFVRGPCSGYAITFEEVVRQIGKQGVFKWWVVSVSSHPIAYLEHRVMYAFYLLRYMTPIADARIPAATNSSADDLSGVTTYGKDTRGLFKSWDMGIKFIPIGLLERIVFNRMTAVGSLLFCVLAVVWQLRRRKARQPLALLSSAVGIGNYVMLAFFGVASEGRYMLATVVCAVICMQELIYSANISAKEETQYQRRKYTGLFLKHGK